MGFINWPQDETLWSSTLALRDQQVKICESNIKFATKLQNFSPLNIARCAATTALASYITLCESPPHSSITRLCLCVCCTCIFVPRVYFTTVATYHAREVLRTLTHDSHFGPSTSLLVPDAASHIQSLPLLHETGTGSVPDVDGETEVQDETVSRVHA